MRIFHIVMIDANEEIVANDLKYYSATPFGFRQQTLPPGVRTKQAKTQCDVSKSLYYSKRTLGTLPRATLEKLEKGIADLLDVG